MAAPAIFQLPRQTPLQLGVTVPGARAYFFKAGTTTPQNVYTTSALDIEHSHPVEADAAGLLPVIYLNDDLSYRVQIKTASDVLIDDQDDINDPNARAPFYGITPAEIAASVTPVNFQYPPGHIYRYGTNTTPGTTDMTAAVQAAFDVGDVITFPEKGNIRITEEIRKDGSTIPLNIISVNMNGSMLQGHFGDDSSNYLLRIDGGGNTGTSTTATTDLVKGETEFDIASATGFVAGDRIAITSTEYFNGIEGESGYTPKTKGELNRIQSIAGTTVTLHRPIKDNYTVSGETVTINKRTTTLEVRIDNGFFVSAQTTEPTGSPPTGTRGLGIEHVEGVRLTRTQFFRFPRFAATTSHCENVYVSSCDFAGVSPTTTAHVGSPWFTGFSAFSCDGVVFTGNTGRDLRRIFDADTNNGQPVCRNIVVSNNISYNCGTAIGSHACENITISGNIGEGSGGIACRGVNVSVINNILNLKDGVSRGISVGHSSGSGLSYSENTPVGKVLVSGNMLRGVSPDRAVRVTGDSTQCVITDNLVAGHGRVIEVEGKVMENLRISGNTIHGESGCQVGVIVPNYSNGSPRESLKNVLVNGNVFSGEMTHMISISGAPANVPLASVCVSNNVGNCTGILRHIQFRGTVGSDESKYFLYPPVVTGNVLNGSPSDNYIQSPQLSGQVAMLNGNQTLEQNACYDVNFQNTLSPTSNLRTYKVGNRIMNSTPAASEFMGIVCVAAGTTGTLSGVTGTIPGSSDQLTVNDASDIAPGAYLTVSGATLTGDAHVLSISGNVITLSESNTGSTATDQAVAYTAPTFKGFGAIES